MEMMDQFNSNFRKIGEYCRERLSLSKFIPLTAFLCFGYMWSVGFAAVRTTDFVLIFLLVFFFRLIDDLFDIEADKIFHPDRVLSKARKIQPFIVVTGVIFLTIQTILISQNAFSSLLLFASLLGVFLIWYAILRDVFNYHLLHSSIILTKYPLFLSIVAPEQAKLEVQFLIYFALFLFEIYDDPILRGEKRAYNFLQAPLDLLPFEDLQNPKHYQFQPVSCYQCGSTEKAGFLIGQEDLSGKPGNFTYVKCRQCNLVYQTPRIHPDQIKDFYDDEYIAHRKKKNWGLLTPLYERAMGKHDRDKVRIVNQYINLDCESRVLDVGCAVGTFLLELKKRYGCHISGVDFKDLSGYPGFEQVEFYNGLFNEHNFRKPYDLITMWHYLEHCYDPMGSLRKAASTLKGEGRIVIEVPRLDSVSFRLFRERWPGVQAPQHTVLFSKKNFIECVENSGLIVEEYLPYGAFPPYFYFFAGTAFKILKGKGLDFSKVLVPYFLGQLCLMPALMLSKKLNLAMQTLVCRKTK